MNLYQQYYNIRHQIDTLSFEEAELKEQIIAELKQSEDNTIKTDFGNFTKRVSKKYIFSPFIEDEEKKLKEKVKLFSKPLERVIEEKKQIEIEEGVAEEVTSVSMAFTYADNKIQPSALLINK